MKKKNSKCVLRRTKKSAVINVKKTDFRLNEIVFAKMCGYPAWPGLICEIGRTIKVFFFGTKNWYVNITDVLTARICLDSE